MVSTKEHDRCVLELRKKEQRNKRRRERNAEARREQQIQFQHHAGSSHVAAIEKRLLRNRQRREVTTKKKELREQEYAHFEGGNIYGLGYDTIVDECTVENELFAGCEGVLHDRGSASGSRRFINIRSVVLTSIYFADFHCELPPTISTLLHFTSHNKPSCIWRLVLDRRVAVLKIEFSVILVCTLPNDSYATLLARVIGIIGLVDQDIYKYLHDLSTEAGGYEWVIGAFAAHPQIDEGPSRTHKSPANAQFGVLGLAIGILPKKVVQTKNVYRVPHSGNNPRE
ncbi:Uncharacterized protein Fot_37848 [Forsythia ovata]|uniref:Uncharacterized protein n=1 Tax=Forsythia ovata TaxID=205694 RepID=A0ABD1S054_9LAMI